MYVHCDRCGLKSECACKDRGVGGTEGSKKAGSSGEVRRYKEDEELRRQITGKYLTRRRELVGSKQYQIP